MLEEQKVLSVSKIRRSAHQQLALTETVLAREPKKTLAEQPPEFFESLKRFRTAWGHKETDYTKKFLKMFPDGEPIPEGVKKKIFWDALSKTALIYDPTRTKNSNIHRIMTWTLQNEVRRAQNEVKSAAKARERALDFQKVAEAHQSALTEAEKLFYELSENVDARSAEYAIRKYFFEIPLTKQANYVRLSREAVWEKLNGARKYLESKGVFPLTKNASFNPEIFYSDLIEKTRKRFRNPAQEAFFETLRLEEGPDSALLAAYLSPLFGGNKENLKTASKKLFLSEYTIGIHYNSLAKKYPELGKSFEISEKIKHQRRSGGHRFSDARALEIVTATMREERFTPSAISLLSNHRWLKDKLLAKGFSFPAAVNRKTALEILNMVRRTSKKLGRPITGIDLKIGDEKQTNIFSLLRGIKNKGGHPNLKHSEVLELMQYTHFPGRNSVQSRARAPELPEQTAEALRKSVQEIRKRFENIDLT